MDEFEFLAVLISIIIGLGVTNLLAGLGQTIHQRSGTRPDPVHLFWTGTALLTLVLNWWVFFRWSDEDIWHFGVFLVIIVWAILLYMLTVLLYPPYFTGKERDHEDYRELFEKNRQWLLAAFALFGVVDAVQTFLRGDLFDPPEYLPFVAHMVILSVVGVFLARRRFQLFLASYLFAVILLWSFVVRRYLV